MAANEISVFWILTIKNGLNILHASMLLGLWSMSTRTQPSHINRGRKKVIYSSTVLKGNFEVQVHMYIYMYTYIGQSRSNCDNKKSIFRVCDAQKNVFRFLQWLSTGKIHFGCCSDTVWPLLLHCFTAWSCFWGLDVITRPQFCLCFSSPGCNTDIGSSVCFGRRKGGGCFIQTNVMDQWLQ